ncbi:outer membrane protein assembly factor BamD [Aestuariivirga sp.]|uniref:outer membrane protein assembly factor BamD n=1 Tax=Aestuariivirga sp. TaxID=2650926 RepID=UPI003918A10F
MIGRSLAAAAIAVLLSGCATSIMDGLWGDDTSASSTSTAGLTAGVAPDMTASQDDAAVAKLYNDGLSELSSGQNKSAIKKFSEVERQYPYSSFATKAILMQAYANYRMGKWDDTVVAANRFVTLHPGHRDAGYAYYLIAVSNYNKIADTRRDQSATQQALVALEEVAQRFPGTPYAADAEQKVIVARDHLAGKEMEVGRFYYRKGSYLAGINRFKRVVTEYRNTSQTPEALYRLSEGYMALGIVSEAQTAAAVLGTNYPDSEWYKDAYNLVSSDGQAPVQNEESWISKAFSSINPL